MIIAAHFLSVGALNALVNVGVWIVHSVCCFLIAKTYVQASNYELFKKGKTDCTDVSDISPEEWLYRRRLKRWHFLSWWTILLLITMIVLIPVELLLEAGIDEGSKCKPRVEKNSTGVCASPLAHFSQTEIVGAMIRVQNFDWADARWDFVLEGASRKPNAREVRIESGLQSHDRTFLVKDCTVRTSVCRSASECGSMTIENGEGPFRTVVTGWSGIPPNLTDDAKRGDFAFDSILGTAFIFWDNGSASDIIEKRPSRTRIRTKGVEMILRETELDRIFIPDKATKWTRSPFALQVNSSRARFYTVECTTDGFNSSNLAVAVSLYRTASLEQPGLQHSNVNGNIKNLKPLDGTDIAKAVYAMKLERWAKSCQGDIDVYTTCGTFNLLFVLPLGVMSVATIIAWAVVRVMFPRLNEDVPHDAQSWRQQAQNLALVLNNAQETYPARHSSRTYAREIFAVESYLPH